MKEKIRGTTLDVVIEVATVRIRVIVLASRKLGAFFVLIT
ncbi:Uncharacterised protein [Streptococcus sp. NCTC 11567]|nr:Uncharacterised protein [Streptococcus dysgalactiae subsp. equisimilis]VUC99185.1 Uncharacterised protein [Streptococcus sp. NCTC 11567]